MLQVPTRGAGHCLAFLLLAGPVCAQQASTADAPAIDPEQVVIIGTSPLPGQGISRDLLPYATHVIQRSRIDASKPLNLVDYLNRSVPGVQVNEITGNPYQGDLTYRGFRASPQLGAGQGLSVFLDGVRINEPFGDVVNFDLIPEFAVRSISLVPGANPAFGLNSLGGALAYTTYDGRSAPGVSAELAGGSFGRGKVSLSHGASSETGWHQYVAATGFTEDGWRDHSDSHLGQFLGKIGHDDGTTGWTLGFLLGRSTLIGNGLVPAYTFGEDGERVPDLYQNRREAIYTHPDETKNRLEQLAFNLQYALDAASSISALAYVRHTRRDTVNGDVAGDPVGDETAVFNTTGTRQTGYGGGLSYARGSGPHQWQVGATLDTADVEFRQSEQPAFFSDTRGTVAAPGSETETSAEVDGKATTFGLYATDTWTVAPRTWLTGTVRYNHSRVSNDLTSRDDDTGELEDHPHEHFSYNSVNPALGIAHRIGDAMNSPTLFANVARNTRVPTVIELGCADPQEPCRLPAGLQSDPFLEQVKSTTVEAGLRWPLAPGMRFTLEAYRTDNREDILFQSVDTSSQLGYFANFPKTRHLGLDAQLTVTTGALDMSMGYSYLKATYEASGTLRQGERNVSVTPGARIAGLPSHTFKLSADWRVAPGWTIGGDMLAVSERGVLGNEDGLLEDPQSGETPEAQRVNIPGYAIFDLRASWKPAGDWEIYVALNNVFDRRYETFGALAGTVFTPAGEFNGAETDAVFVAPGTPRSFWAGLRYRF